MCHSRLQARVPSAESIGAVRKAGYRLCINKISHDGSSKCNVVSDVDGDLWGVLFSMDVSELPVLDRAEGLGYGYTREEIVIAFSGKKYSSFVYVAQEEYICSGVLPFGWYMDFVCTGAREHDIPKEYCDKLNDWGTHKDSNKERALLNRQLLAPSL
jgi:gamma-glutamylcyclotransferase